LEWALQMMLKMWDIERYEKTIVITDTKKNNNENPILKIITVEDFLSM
jgi:hypothetical protein